MVTTRIVKNDEPEVLGPNEVSLSYPPRRIVGECVSCGHPHPGHEAECERLIKLIILMPARKL